LTNRCSTVKLIPFYLLPVISGLSDFWDPAAFLILDALLSCHTLTTILLDRREVFH
jgi:hypothetical protein